MIEGQYTIVVAVNILFLMFGVIFMEPSDYIYVHCTQTERNRFDLRPRTIIPKRTTASVLPQAMPGINSISLDLCPDSRFLKISWTFNQTQDSDIKLCYRMDNALDGVLNTTCFLLKTFESVYPSKMDCWFPMIFMESGPVVTAWIHPSPSLSLPYFSGRLNTSYLDPGYTCKDMCEVVAMNIGSQIDCHNMASIIYDTTSTVVKRLSFDAIDNLACKNNKLHIARKTDSRLEYQLNCGFNGLGFVKVLYTTHGKYCLKYQQVTVRCHNGSSITKHIEDEPDDIHSFGTFVIFGCVCIVVISLAFFGIIFAVQWLMHIRNRYLKSRRGSKADSRNISISADDSIPLNIDKFQPKGSVPETSSQITNMTVVPSKSRRRFSSTSSSKTQEIANAKQVLMVPKMRKSVTMALLEDTDPFYKKRILFLPIPFDHFTNEVTKILKSIFTNEAGLFSQCCYDRNVHKHFMTGDRVKWISNILADHDKILVFLCFTSVYTEQVVGKDATMVDEILDRLVLTNLKVQPPTLCKVVFLYLTDRLDNVQSKHYGDIFHISNSETFSKFICNVMNFCGRSKETYPEMINKILKSSLSKHFLHFVGIRYKQPEVTL